MRSLQFIALSLVFNGLILFNVAALLCSYTNPTEFYRYEVQAIELWIQLYSDYVGIMSAIVIAFVILMGVWFTRYFYPNDE